MAKRRLLLGFEHGRPILGEEIDDDEDDDDDSQSKDDDDDDDDDEDRIMRSFDSGDGDLHGF